MVKDLIEQTGANDTTTSDGNTALKLAQEHNPNLIIADLRLPLLSGINLCQQPSQNNPERPILALAATATDSQNEICENTGFTEMVKKPLDSKQLYYILTKYLTAPKATQ